MRIFAGYAGWGEEQLEAEIARGLLVRRPVGARGPVRRRPERALDAGAAPAAGRARLGVDPAGRPDHELADPQAGSSRSGPSLVPPLDSTLVSTQMSPGTETIEDRRTRPDRRR